MKIKNIKKLNNFGIFRNHSNSAAKDFGRYNLLYGWNGSGKSTLSEVFRCIENSAPSSKFPSSEFYVNVDCGAAVTQANVSESDLNVYTFNHDFIDENISWNSVVKSILIVDKAKIKEREKLEELKKKQKSDNEAYVKETENIENMHTAVSRFETEGARHIKTSLQSIDTADRYYLNYDKRKFKAFITENLKTMKSEVPLLDDQEISELTTAAKPDQKSRITFTQQTVNQETFTKATERLGDLLKASVISQTIQRLAEHGDIKSWVETGLGLHKRHDTSQCEFCGNTIPEKRTKQLEAYFNDDYKAFQDRLVRADSWLADQYIKPSILPATGDFYDEFKKECGEACSAWSESIATLNKEISAWHAILKEKTGNPLETGLTVEAISRSSIKACNDAMTAISEVVRKHNHKSGNFEEETTKAKKKLESYYAATEVRVFNYHEKKKEAVDRTTENSTLKTAIKSRNTEILTLENSLSNEGLGADKFNESLHKFLGRSELTLRFDTEKKGYEILRNDSGPVGGNLSEGEKTAIAFVYFITKLKENNNNIEDVIVVVDDPISSFDSIHLFHAYSFMKVNCEYAKQLFVLTHNFTFFKLVRDWISRKNKRGHQNIANFYVVKATNEKPRTSTYTDAEPALTLYNSEYHYIFSRLHSLKNQQTLATDDHFLAANLSRKLLEAFLSFKFPKNRGNFANLFNTALDASKNPKDEDKEKIRKFINEYSHNDFIGVNEDFVENLMGEGVAVISAIFNWISELDEKHYQEMIDVVT